MHEAEQTDHGDDSDTMRASDSSTEVVTRRCLSASIFCSAADACQSDMHCRLNLGFGPVSGLGERIAVPRWQRQRTKPHRVNLNLSTMLSARTAIPFIADFEACFFNGTLYRPL